MPSKVTGRIAKVRKTKNATQHQRNHRWQSFSTKISQFNSLQPLRRVRRHDLDNEDDSVSTSYFQNGLQKWTELNLSKGFTSFRREVWPLCDTLAQILHFETRIMDLLEKYISEQDKESLEPLLDLLTAFAHDLGVRFEKHYAKSLNLIIAIAAKPQAVEVIEWTFGALAFLFKYLSKLIVPDLRPTYDVMSNILGKSRHPPHIARFAAEAMSFLIRKAASPSHRESSLIPLAAHIRDDITSMVGERQYSLYRDGIMTMFAEAIKGTEGMIHSVGGPILATLVDAIPDTERTLGSSLIWTDMVCGVLTSSIHHARVEHFEEYEQAIYEKMDSIIQLLKKETPSWKMVPYIKIMSTLGGVRKGSRIGDWNRLVEQTCDLMSIAVPQSEDLSFDEGSDLWTTIMANAALICHHAPVDAIIPQLTSLISTLTKEPFTRWFVPFCAYFCELDARRFGSLYRTEFQKFVATKWSHGNNEEMLCILLPKMMENRAFPPCGEKDCLKLPQSWQDQIVSKFENLEISPFPERGPYNKDPQVWRDRCLPKYAALFKVLELTSLHPSTNARIAELLLRKLKLALRPSSSLASDEVHFIVSQGFHAYLGMSAATASLEPSLSPLLYAAIPRFARSVGFLKGYLEYMSRTPQQNGTTDDVSDDNEATAEEDAAIKSLIQNLSSHSHDIRLVSLQILQKLKAATDIVDIMLQIEETPLGLQHTRTIAMHLRKLAQEYNALEDKGNLAEAVPAFMFGMMTVKLSPVWDDAAEALKQITESKVGEQAVSDLAFQWVNVPSARWKSHQTDSIPGRRFYSDFECTSLQSLYASADKIQDDTREAGEVMLKSFDAAQQLVEIHAEYARTRALKVLDAIPAVAEKRSRQLVPHFLCWAVDEEEAGAKDIDEEEAEDQGATWSLVDRKALLGVFSKFVNPRVLYEHEQVYKALLQLMENGDIEVQKLALKAILTWKQVGVKTYQENLEFLLDEARFKNELAVFLQNDELIKDEHRAELMPVLLRLLYGRTISKKGVASGRHGLQATRLAVIRNLSIAEMGKFLDIATGKLRDVQVLTETVAQRKALFKEPLITARKQVGFLNMTTSLIAELGTNVSQYMTQILNPVLYCLVYACMHLNEPETDASEDTEEQEKASNISLLRVIRSTGIKCINALFQNAQDFQWQPYHDIIIEEVVAPRVENLPNENTQGVSGIMQLFSTWSVLPRAALFLAPHKDVLPQGILPKVIECIAVAKAKDDVRVCALDILRNLVKLALMPAKESEFNEIIKDELLDANVDQFLTTVTTVLQEQHTSPALLEACLESILSFAPIVSELKNIQEVVHIASYLLNQPPRRVSPKAKGRILLIVEGFISSAEISLDEELLRQVYDTLSSLFSYFKDRENRQSLSRALLALSKQDSEIAAIASLCNELNAFKEGRIDEPDYDRRLASFNSISTERDVPWTPKQWLPLLHNTIFYIRMDEEFGILSSNSADGIRRFIKNAADASSEQDKQEFETQLKSVLMPALYGCAREPAEAVRRETLRVFGFLVATMPTWPQVADLAGLLQGQSEEGTEVAFFFDLLSPALSKQLEALRTLEAANNANQMDSQNLSHFFIPMLEHFIFGRIDGTDDQGLGAQATNTIGSLAMSLSWNHYRTTFQRYIGYIGSKEELQKQTVRLAGRFADALALTPDNSSSDEMDIDEAEKPTYSKQRLASTVPAQEQLTTEVMNTFLPTLTKYLHEKDESEVSYRVPVGVIIVKLLKLLPEGQMEQRLAGVLTDISHILRSKSVESRDLTRDTLVKIAVTLGSQYFGFILRELRSALKKGYQLHVLSYTMHSILVATVPTFTPGDLDHCLSDIVMVIMDDIFGVVGQEKDAEGYTSQTKEIKSTKSHDSMELIAKNASVTQLIRLVRPIRSLLMQKVDLKMVRKIDSLMARITAGLLQNPAAETRDTLVFCYEVIQDVYESEKPEAEQKMDPRIKKYLVQKGANRSGDRGKMTKNTHKLVRFAFDILRSMFRKHDSLRTPEHISGFLPLIGDALVGSEEEVKIAAFRILTVIVKVPMPEADGTSIFKVAVKEATRSISISTSTGTELSQSALKLLAAVLRDRRDIPVKDAAIDLLLGKLKDDFTEPLYRHVTFNFLRSVMERRVETAAVYDTLDHVGTVMITNDDKDTRDLARGAFFQFIREYPQKKARWSKQLDFVVANLKYDREGGRLSVMEILHLLLTKASSDFTQEIASTCFLPLFFVIANDDSEKCRLAASALIKEIFRKSDKEHTQKFLTLLRSWLEKDDSSPVVKFGIQVFGHYFEGNEASEKNKKDFSMVLSKVSGILSSNDIADIDGELAIVSLNVIEIFTGLFPEKVLSSENKELWNNVVRCISHPEVQAKLAAIRLVAQYVADFAKNSGKSKPGETMVGSYDLELDTSTIQDYIRIAFNSLSGRNVDEALATEASQLLIFLGPRLPDAVNSTELTNADEDAAAADIEEAEEEPAQKDLSYVFRRLSHILRREIPPRAVAITGKVSAMEILETICRRIPIERLQPCLKTVMEPLHNLTDPSIPMPFSADELFKTKYEGIKTRAQIMMDSLQKKVGTAEYSKLLLEIREQVRAKRLQRTSKRKIEAIAHPEKYGRDKRKKLEKDKERRKNRSKEQKSMRESYKRW